jgi:hypothetical protein
MPDNTTTSPAYRSGIQSLVLPGIKAIRIAYRAQAGGNVSPMSFHVYGKITAGEIRWLLFTDTGGTEVTGPYFDFGDDPRGGMTETKTFKVKNGHATLTANTITLSCSSLTNKSPSFVDDYTFSTDGTTYTATLNLGNLAPGVSTGTLYVKRTTPLAAALSVEAPLFSAVAGSWA